VTDVPNVAIFASSFHPALGGVEELVRQLAQHQQAEAARPMVLTMRWPKTLPEHEVVEGIPVSRHVFRLPERRARWLAAYSLETLSIQRAIDRELHTHGAELVHVQCVSGNALYAYRAARRLGLPLVVSLQGELSMDAARVYEHSDVLLGLLAFLLQNADAVTACSASTLAEAEAATGVRLGPRGHVVHNGVSITEFDRADPERRSRPYIFALGRHVHQKGFDVLLEAYSTLLSTAPDAPDLVLAGDGPERGSLEALTRRLGLTSRVAFVGRTDRPRTSALFRGCELFVLPSRHEPQGIVNLEAMAAGKPVVATDVGGVAEIVIDHETGLLVRPQEPLQLASAMTDALADRTQERLGRAGRLRAEQFDWSQVTATYGDVYRAVQDRARTRELPHCRTLELWRSTAALRPSDLT
jgi:glycogen(starch) synthase